MIALITGPVRSGKSARALATALAQGGPVVYVATLRADPADAEMRDRIARHRADRPPGVRVVELWESGRALHAVVAEAARDTVLVVDSLGTWVAGHLLDLEALAGRDARAALAELEARTEGLLAAVRGAPAHVILVAEETGWGLVPPHVLGRIFRDRMGHLTQSFARIADRVDLVVAGYAVDLKRYGTPVRP